MLRKGVDAIIVNDVSLPGLGFDSDENAGHILSQAETIDIPPMPKRQMAARILDRIPHLRTHVSPLTTTP